MEYQVSGISSNLVMVQPTEHITKIGQWVAFDVHEPSKNFTVRAKVLAVPDRLLHSKDACRKLKGYQGAYGAKIRQFLNNRSLEYATDMELVVGDEIVFQYINHASCMGEGLYWHLGEKNPALFIGYDQIYMILRDGKQILPNGWVWVEPCVWTKDSAVADNGAVVGQIGQKVVGHGIVRNFGKPNRGYLYEDWQDADDLKEGDKVLFKHTAGVSAEWFCHKTLNDGKFPYYVMQRHDIYAIKH